MGLSSPAVALVVGAPAAYLGYKAGHTVGYWSGESYGRSEEQKICEEKAENARKGMEKANADRAAELAKLNEAELEKHKSEVEKWKAGTTTLEATLTRERSERKNVALQCWSVEVVRGIRR